MQVKMNFQKDFEDIVTANLRASDSKVADTVNPARVFVMLSDNKRRQVPADKYKIHFSEEVVGRPEWLTYQGPITDIVKRLEAGHSITHCLSRTSVQIDHADGLLNYWGFNHLHLVLDGRRQKKSPTITKSRTPHHLYFRVNGDDFYFIDILKHPPPKEPSAWIEAHLVRTADRNWPQLHRLYETEPSSTRKLTDEDHKVLFSNGTNALVETERGLVIPALGTMCDKKSSVDATMQWVRMVRAIKTLQSYVWEHQSTLFSDGNEVDRRLSLTEVESGGSTFHVFDHVSQTKIIFRFP